VSPARAGFSSRASELLNGFILDKGDSAMGIHSEILSEPPPSFRTVFSSKIFEVFFLFPVRGEKRKRDFFRKNTCEAASTSTIRS
jgi:hypothetical protein